MSEEADLRRQLVRMGELLYTRQLAHGTAGNLSVKLDDGTILVTPTNSSLGDLDRGPHLQGVARRRAHQRRQAVEGVLLPPRGLR